MPKLRRFDGFGLFLAGIATRGVGDAIDGKKSVYKLKIDKEAVAMRYSVANHVCSLQTLHGEPKQKAVPKRQRLLLDPR